MKNTKARKKPGKGLVIILSVVCVFTILVNIAFRLFSGHADLYLGRGTAIIETAKGTESWDSNYYLSDYSSDQEVKAAAEEMVRTIEAEGIVLMKNNGVLPLETGPAQIAEITVLGRDSVDAVYGGAGSGSVNLSTVVDFGTALKAAGYKINETVYSVLLDYASFSTGPNQFGQPKRLYENPKADIVMDKPEKSTYYIGEMPVENYTSAVVASFSDYSDAAIVVFGRGGGEGGDLTTDMQGFDNNYVPGQHQLELNYDEKAVLELAKENFDKVIVVINSSTSMELGILEDDDEIDAVLWIGSPGQTGFYAVGEVLNGSVTPSGRTADIYASDFTKDPTFANFGFYQYENISKRNAEGNGFFVQYEEGIYYGYRYYETAATEGFIDYNEAVVYPFGYGLSYTDFDWDVVDQKLDGVDGKISIDVKVTNTGDKYPGKDVVQLYYSPPYYEGGIEKAEVVLGDFGKTKLLAPGESEILTLSIAVEDMASYDYKNEKAYVLDAGNYGIRIQTDSHNMKDGIEEVIYTVDKTIVYSGKNHRESDMSEVTNQFDDVSELFTDSAQEGMITNMSRSDFSGTFPTPPNGKDFVATEAIIAAFQPYFTFDHINEDAEMPVTGKDNGLFLINLRGRDFNDPLWQDLLDQLDPEEIATIVINSAYNTGALESVGKPSTIDLDGPAGFNSFMGEDIHGTAYPSAVVIASTFNTQVAHEMGRMIGNEGLMLGVSGWYAPAVNLHRSPFAGRNFEYYSEDPVLSGKIGAAVVSGTADKGVYSYVKHYALNDQETNRNNNGVCTWANEQTVREIYLKPFELIAKNAKTTVKYIADENGILAEKEIPANTALMSSFNRVGAVWAGGSYPLMQTVLRDEWGFKGVTISDFNLYSHMYVNQGLMAGTDINITFESMKDIDDTTSAAVIAQLKRTAHRMLYTVAHSHAMNGIVPGTTIRYTMAPWQLGLIIADIVVALFVAGGVLFLRRRRKAHA